MALEITGRITHLLEELTGEGRNGTWRKKSFVVEVPGTYPRSVCFDVWNDNIDAFPLQENKEVKVSFDLDSREYNGRWFTNAKAWRVEEMTAPQQEAPRAGVQMPNENPWPTVEDMPAKNNTAESGPSTGEVDDLPF